MKKITLSLFLMGSLFANAQTITQSTSQTIEDANTIACVSEDGLATAANSYFRYFELATDHNITEAYTISKVQFGIQTALNIDGSYPVFVKLYATTLSRDAFDDSFETLTDITLLGQQTYEVEDQDLTIFDAAIAATVPAGSNLVVEVGYEGDETGQTFMFLGSNTEGETDPTYIMSTGETGCNINKPTPISTVAPPGSTINLVMNVVGTTGTAGVEENALTAIAVHPNPTNGLVNIQMPNNMIVNSATITDVTGKVMSVNVNANTNTVNISNYASGVYFLNLTTDLGNVTRKIVKE
jgi:hypothetical protein